MEFPFDIYTGLTVDQVASTKEGLIYIDYIVGFMKEKGMDFTYLVFYNYLVNYVKNPTITREIDEALEDIEISFNKSKKWWE